MQRGLGGEGMSQLCWLTPPDVFKKLDDEFHLNFDPCPYPRPADYDGCGVEWGTYTYFNPPFRKVDAFNGKGPTAFMRKAILENQLGKTVVIVAPVQSYVGMMVDAGAELRNLGRVRWLNGETKEPCKDPSTIVAFILRGSK